MRPVIVALAAAVVTATIGVASAEDLSSFTVPLRTADPAKSRQVAKPEAVAVKTLDGSALKQPVVYAASTQDAVNAAMEMLRAPAAATPPSAPDAKPEPPAPAPEAGPVAHSATGLTVMRDGVRVIDTPSGYGIVSGATATYDAMHHENPNLVLVEQRLAFVEAELQAKAAILSFLKGLDLRSKQEFVSRLQTADTDTFSGANSDRTSDETIDTVVAGYLAGIVTYDVDDDPDKGEVFVAVVSTPKTRGEVRACGSAVTLASAADLGIERVLEEIQLGVMPPDGARIVTVPGSGETAWIGFGADFVPINSEPRLVPALKDKAKSIARQRADRSLVALLHGEALKAESQVDARFSSAVKQFDTLTDEAGAQTVDAKPLANASTLYTSLVSKTNASTVNGQVPAGTQRAELMTADGRWIYSVAIYRESTLPLLNGSPPAPAKSTAPAPPSQPAPPAPPAPPASGDSGPCGTAPSDGGFTRVRARGTGPTREEAVLKALKDAQRQAAGAYVDASTIFKKQYEDAISDCNAKLEQSTQAKTDLKENIDLTSNGIIRSFRYLADGPLPATRPEWQAGDRFEVELCVDIPVFDPAQPRPGRRATIAMIPLFTSKPTFKIGNEEQPAQTRAQEFAQEVTAFLLQDNRFTVIDREYMKAIDQELDLVRKRTGAGEMQPEEMAKIGHLLGADYLLTGTLVDLEYSTWDEFVAIRNRNEPRLFLNVNVHLRLVNAATGEVLWSKPYSQSWDIQSVGDLSRRYAGGDRSMLAMKDAAGALMPEVLAKISQLSAEQVRIEVVRVEPMEVIVLAPEGVLQKDDILDVFKIEHTDFKGRTIDIETPVARIGVLRLGKGLGYCKVLTGDRAAIAPEMVCRRVSQ